MPTGIYQRKPRSLEYCRKLSKALTGIKRKKRPPHSEETKRKIGEANKISIKKLWQDLEYKRCMSIAHTGKLGVNASNWKGGISSLKTRIRILPEYKQWTKQVYERDNYTCQECGQWGGKLEAHHIKAFSIILAEFLKEYNQFSPIDDKETLVRLATKYEPFWNISDGKTMCKDCHKLTDTYLNKKEAKNNGKA